MTNQSDICVICGQPKSSSMTGSFTQWVAACRCEQIDRSKGQLQICALCGKQIDKGSTGSFTQWVLQSQNCSCESPVPMDPNLSSATTPALTDAALTVPIRKTVEQEISDLGVDSFPLERYKPIEKLGAGGGGAVYLCFDKHLRKNVAVKISFAKVNAELINFQAEAKVTAKFKHPNIVSIIDFGLTPTGAPFMVLEHVNGLSLDKFILENGHIEEQIAIPLFIQIASALAKGHESGIFHRDMKSSNILITREGKKGEPFARIIDFGIALMTGQETTKFHGKNIIGTPKYMSPDQLLGRTFDARSEIYSFGCVMYETLTGSLPFKGDALSLLDMHTNLEPPSFASVAPDVRVSSYMERLVRRCLEKDPDLRYGSVKELVEALQRAEGDDIIESSSVQKTIDINSLSSSATMSSPTSEADSDATARRKAFEAESRKRALTDEMAIPGSANLQQGEVTDRHSPQNSKKLMVVLLAVSLLIALGSLATLGVILLKQESEPFKEDIPKTSTGITSEPSPTVASTSTSTGAEDFSNEHDLESLKAKVAVLERNHQYKEAEAAYSRMITLQPTVSEFFRLRGLARKHQGKFKEAIGDFNEAIEVLDIDTANTRARADYYLDCGQYTEALKDINFALDLEPENIENLLLKARIMMINQSPPGEIEQVLNKAVKRSNESGLAHALRSLLYSQLKRTAEADKDMDKAIEYSGNDPLVYYCRGFASGLKGDSEHAIFYMDKAIKFAPYMWQAYLARAKLRENGKHDEQAVEDYEKAMSLNPENKELCVLATKFYLKEHPREARRSITRAIKLAPQPEDYAMRAQINLQLANYEDVAKDCEAAIKDGYKTGQIYRDYGIALSSLMKFKEAETAFTKALEYQPDFLNALLQRARVYEKLGKDQKALTDYSAVLKLSPYDVRCRERRANLYDRIGKPDLAAKDRATIKNDYSSVLERIQTRD